jgi:heat-inducible transcriptional repressor
MEDSHTLNARQKDVLKTIIISHIQSAVPIGSASVADILDLSSATIRNVMGELEDMGYISKPHTSAGRIPTATGYRHYVNNLLELNTVSNRQKRLIEEEYYGAHINSLESALKRISHLLAMMTRYAGIACVSDLKFYIEGTSYMMEIPEFKDLHRMRSLLKIFDEKGELLRLLNEDLNADGVKIHISEEDRFEALKDLTLITANYKIKNSTKGSLGVLGPVRMNYSTLIPLVDFFSQAMEMVLDEMEIKSEWDEGQK